MGGKRMKMRNPVRTREAILAAAQDEFGRKGYAGGRVEVVAKRARTNKRMIYHYFGNKEGLYLAVLERVYTRLRQAESELGLKHLDPRTAIRRLTEFSFDYLNTHPEVIRLITDENLYRARHLRKSVRVPPLHDALVGTIEDILGRGVSARVFRKGIDPISLYIAIAARSYFFFSNQWTLSVIFGRDLRSRKAFLQYREQSVRDVLAAVMAR